MKLNADSPELTAYALGELDRSTEAEVEAALAADPSLRREVDSIRTAAAELSRSLALEPSAGLLPGQRECIARSASGRPANFPVPARAAPSKPSFWRDWFAGTPVWGILAAGAAAVVLTFALRPRPHEMLVAENFSDFRYVHPAIPVTNTVVNGARNIQPGPAQSGTEAGAKPIVVTEPPPSDPAAPPVATSLAAASPNAATPVQPAEIRTPTQPSSKVEARVALEASPAPVTAPAPSGAAGRRIDNLRASEAGGATLLKRDVGRQYGADYFNAPQAASRPEAETPRLAYRYGLSTETTAGGGAALKAGEELDPLSRGVAPNGGRLPDEKLRRYHELDQEHLVVRPRASSEGYAPIVTNPFRAVSEAPLSTFSLDVDTASYANVRRFLREGSLPPPNAVRLEEMVNYFSYDAPPVSGEHPVSAQAEVSECPWKPEHHLVRLTVKARDVVRTERARANVVFLVDVSGSMEPENKLPLVQRSLRLLTEKLTARDSVAVVTYAGEAGVALPPSNGAEKEPILAAIDRLKAGGSTHGSAGIRTAYELARTNFLKDGINRVILCTDGDFNVGLTSREDLLGLISEEAKSGIFLTVLGFGMGNYQDSTTELLADKGNGNYAYIDSFREAQKVLNEQLEAMLVTVAKDVKLQVEFNPERVIQWKLLGYENRLLADRDFNDDTKDAGELGAGHVITALYEVVPVGGIGPGVDPLRYQPVPAPPATVKTAHPDELMQIKIRYKLPDAQTSRMFQLTVKDKPEEWARAGRDQKFSAAVAGFAMLLRSTHPSAGSNLNYDLVLKLAEQGLGEDPQGYRGEFIDLVRRTRQLTGK